MEITNHAFIQARMSSTRLPGKVLKLINGKPVLWHVVSRLQFSKNLTKIVVLTSTDKSDDEISDYCKDQNFLCFRGDLDDVLKRFYDASNFYNSDNIIRITADCPLIDPVIVDDLKGITVPDSFIENIVNFSGKLDEGSVATFEEKPVEFLKEAKLSEQKITSLVERLKLLIQEAREVMTEMTTSGMVGSGIQRNLLKKKKKRKT